MCGSVLPAACDIFQACTVCMESFCLCECEALHV